MTKKHTLQLPHVYRNLPSNPPLPTSFIVLIIMLSASCYVLLALNSPTKGPRGSKAREIRVIVYKIDNILQYLHMYE